MSFLWSSEAALLLATASSALMAIFLRLFNKAEGNSYEILLGNYLVCTVIGFFSLPDISALRQIDRVTFCCSLVSGFLFVGGLICMQAGIRENGAILTAAFARLGLIVPLVFSILILGERPGLLRFAGLLLVFCAIWVLGKRSKIEKGPADGQVNLTILMIVLFVCGAGDSMAKVYEHVGDRAKDELYYFYTFATAFLITGCLLIYEKYRRHNGNLNFKLLVAGILVGIPNYYASFLLLKALVGVPAFIVYPTFSTGAILLVSLISVMFLKQKLSRKNMVGLVLIMAGLLFLNLK